MTQLNIQYIPTENLTPHPNNPRQGDIPLIIESITANGIYKPVIVQKTTGHILAGNHTYQALKALGHKTIPVTYVDVDNETARRILLVDNRANDLATYDEELLQNILSELPDLYGTGYTLDDIETNFELDETTNPDEAPTPPETPKTKPSDIWQLGKHRVICADTTLPETWQQLMQNQKAYTIWTDPPYGVDYTGGTKDSLKIQNDNPQDLPHLLGEAFKRAVENTREAAAVYIAYASAQRHAFEEACNNAGISIRQDLIWAKNQPTLGWADYHWKHEPLFYGFTPGGQGRKGRGGPHWYGDDTSTTVFEIPKPQRNAEHPTMKPIDLIRPMLKNSTKPGGLVIDPFGGSGSTLIAAHLEGFTCYTSELDPRFVDVICRRYEELTGNTPVLERTGTAVTFL